MKARLGLLAGAVLVAGALFFFHREGAHVDACADTLVEAARAKDEARVAALVEGQAAVRLLAAQHAVEVGFARPMDAAWARVGLFLRPTATATQARVFTLLLDLEARPKCRFLRDYEPGAFQSDEAP